VRSDRPCFSRFLTAVDRPAVPYRNSPSTAAGRFGALYAAIPQLPTGADDALANSDGNCSQEAATTNRRLPARCHPIVYNQPHLVTYVAAAAAMSATPATYNTVEIILSDIMFSSLCSARRTAVPEA